MKDAFGGIVNLALVSVFLVVVMGVLGLTVNYTKAFRAKNIIISSIEEYSGSDGCFDSSGSCYRKIKNELENIGYFPHSLNCPIGTGAYNTSPDKTFCYLPTYETDDVHKIDGMVAKHYKIITQVDIDIPIINKIMGLYFFQVKGDSRVVYTRVVTSGTEG